ncbi:uncharacterized protein FTOL_11886 [Fusarium torulosum]|uniref:Uncharacterized protein n=1 Tax=Fusarium torulosum TaxID=33205 RepID=A0AAE8MIX3_9HYPO|nr:uncharacterized protein FTOL_11886 [Fusarium torulosum]
MDRDYELTYFRYTPQVHKDLRIGWSWHKLMMASGRYFSAFDRHPNPYGPGPEVTDPEYKGCHLRPWIVEAPFNSVEVLEAILKPDKPLRVHKTRHVRRPCASVAHSPSFHSQRGLIARQRRYAEYARFQGRLEQDREVSFVCLPERDYDKILDVVKPFCYPVHLVHLSIPWRDSLEFLSALIPYQRRGPRRKATYPEILQGFLKHLGIPDCDFQRSLLEPGTTPLPDNLEDLLEGIPGASIALPYYRKVSEVKEEDIKEEDIKEEDIKEEDIKEEDIKEEDIKEEDTKNEEGHGLQLK